MFYVEQSEQHRQRHNIFLLPLLLLTLLRFKQFNIFLRHLAYSGIFQHLTFFLSFSIAISSSSTRSLRHLASHSSSGRSSRSSLITPPNSSSQTLTISPRMSSFLPPWLSGHLFSSSYWCLKISKIFMKTKQNIFRLRCQN